MKLNIYMKPTPLRGHFLILQLSIGKHLFLKVKKFFKKSNIQVVNSSKPSL